MNTGGSKPAPPEEKLLRLIRGKTQPASAAATNPRAAQSSGAALGAVSKGWRVPAWLVTVLNVVVGGIVAGELVALALMAITPERPVNISLPPPTSGTTPSATTALQHLPSVAATVSRPVFEQLVETSTPTTTTDTVKPANPQAQALASRLSLIGVVAGESPQAIIEDSQTHKTFFVTVGQGVVDGLVVKEIHENRVVLNLNGEAVELSL